MQWLLNPWGIYQMLGIGEIDTAIDSDECGDADIQIGDGPTHVRVDAHTISIRRYDATGNLMLPVVIDVRQLIVDALQPELTAMGAEPGHYL